MSSGSIVAIITTVPNVLRKPIPLHRGCLTTTNVLWRIEKSFRLARVMINLIFDDNMLMEDNYFAIIKIIVITLI